MDFAGFFHYASFTLVDYLNLHVIFNCMYIVFLDLIWL